MQPHQIVVLGFLGLIALGTILLSLPMAAAPGKHAGLVNALFTTTSAVCVTGLVTVDTATTWSPFGQVVILLLIQVGGLGIMTMSTLIALLRGKKISLPERLVMQEALGQLQLSGVVRLTRAVLLTTLIFELTGGLLLALRWGQDMPPLKALYFGIFHAVSAFNNAGFDLFSISMVGYQTDVLVNLVVAGLVILGGLGFVVIIDVWRFLLERKKGQHYHMSVQTKLVLAISGGLLLLSTVLILFWEWNNPNTLGPLSPGHKLLAAFFQAVVPRTAGFNSVPIAGLREVTLFFMVMLMFVGASPGGTGGGIKTTTFGIIIMTVWNSVKGRREVELFGRRMPREMTDRSLAIAAISLFWVTSVILILSVSESGPILAVIFETMSAFGTVGLSMGLTPDLTTFGRLIIVLTMFLGRVGPLTLTVVLANAHGREGPPVRHPEERIMVG